ncbi:beta-galactosidase [Halyomorpha halys]|uniref:beta-galactosidase n=1 Tax=Halyomorpha halys TaxID=286706 RepID=UPI0006D515BE|nr:beta-galactosidase [Halyomorpha halys]
MLPLTSLFVLLLTDILLLLSVQRANSKPTFEVDYNNNQFLKDGEPFIIVSGELHYFRIPRFYWRDRLVKLKAAGCNTVSTYVEWSSHEPQLGFYSFRGEHNITRFLSIAQNLGLSVILRPGPYVCTERDFGGFPAWLLTQNPEMKLRTNDQSYMFFVKTWFRVLFREIEHLFYGNGGPIIMVQIENEYGSYPINDKKYLISLRDFMNGYIRNNAVLFTTDGFSSTYVTRGKIPGVFATVDFGPSSGGDPRYKADITSYDYDAPISEAGDLTPKYLAIREVILKFFNTYTDLIIPKARKKGNYGVVKLQPVCSLFSCPIGKEYQPKNGLLNFEAFGQDYGFISYSTPLKIHSQDPSVLKAQIRDRAIVYLDDNEVGTLMYTVINELPLPPTYDSGQKLTLLIENMGRRNYGLLSDGIVGNVTVDSHLLSNWDIKGYPFSADDIYVLSKIGYTDYFFFPAVFRGQFRVPRGSVPLDTFISMENWGKGVVFINGHNIGRYWKIGPQITLYVPLIYLKRYPEMNDVIVIELHYCDPDVSVRFVNEPIYLTNYTKTKLF